MAFNLNLPSKHVKYNNLASFPQTGNSAILYVANDTGKLYTWTNSTYVEVDKKIASSWGSVSQAPEGSAISVSKSDVGLDQVDNTSDLDKPISTQTQTVLDNKQNLLVSGTNIKTINNTSLLGSGNLSITASATWGGITGTLSSQTDLQSAINAKQSTLVSGSNIKTINSTSLVGSGNVAVQPTLVAGTNLKYINGFSLLGSGDLLTPMGVQALIKPQTAQYVSTMPFGVVGSLGAVTGVVNRLYVYPFIATQDIAIQAMLINVITGFAGSFARIVYYVNTTLNGGDYPGTKAFESTSLDCSTTGLKTASISTQFNKGQIYWVGVHVSSAPGLLATVQSNMLSLGYNSAASNYCHLNQSTTFGSLPSNFGTGFPQTSTCPQVFLQMV